MVLCCDFLLYMNYTAQNKYVCTRLLALFDVLNLSLNKKLSNSLSNSNHFTFLLQLSNLLYRFEEGTPLNQNSQNLAPSLKQQKTWHHFNFKFLSSLNLYMYDIYSI